MQAIAPRRKGNHLLHVLKGNPPILKLDHQRLLAPNACTALLSNQCARHASNAPAKPSVAGLQLKTAIEDIANLLAMLVWQAIDPDVLRLGGASLLDQSTDPEITLPRSQWMGCSTQRVKDRVKQRLAGRARRPRTQELVAPRWPSQRETAFTPSGWVDTEASAGIRV